MQSNFGHDKRANPAFGCLQDPVLPVPLDLVAGAMGKEEKQIHGIHSERQTHLKKTPVEVVLG